MAADINNIFQVFRKWDLSEDSPISESHLGNVLEKVSKMSKRDSSAFFANVDADRDGRISYSDLEGWFLSHDVLRSCGLLQRCKCPDGHDLVTFRPETDGWCCEECGDDLEASQQVLRCHECDGLCYCVRCMVLLREFPAIEKALLTAIPLIAKKVTRASVSVAAVEVERRIIEEDGDEDSSEEEGLHRNASLRRSRSSLNYLDEAKEATPAEELYIEELVGQLHRKGTQIRLDALQELGGLLKDSRLAPTLASHGKVIVGPLDGQADASVQLEVLSLLRRLAELGQAEVIAGYAYVFTRCLSNKDIIIARKTAMLFCILAREGSAELLTQHIPSLLQCFERTDYKITAPLEALQAIAEFGEGKAVAPTVSKLHPVLMSLSSRCRGAVCILLGAIFRGGGGDTLFREFIRDCVDEHTGPSSDKDASLLKALLLIVRDEEEDEVRLQAAEALQSIILFNEDTVKILRNQHSLLMFNCVGTHHCNNNHENREACNIITEIMGIHLSGPTGDPKASKSEDEDGGEVCSVCFTAGLRCQRGGPRTLPCGHTFHAKCVDDWFGWETKCGRGQSCPLCRYIVPLEIKKDKNAARQSGCQSPTSSGASPTGRRNTERHSSVTRLRRDVSAARAAEARAALLE